MTWVRGIVTVAFVGWATVVWWSIVGAVFALALLGSPLLVPAILVGLCVKALLPER